jgi:hypothetical protein
MPTIANTYSRSESVLLNRLTASLVLIALFVLSACNVRDEAQTVVDNSDPQKVWVFTQINVPEEDGGMETFYYYGRVSKKLFARIKDNTVTRGFLFLADVHYYDSEDDKVHPYEDKQREGELVFRIEDVKRFELLKRAPRTDVKLSNPDAAEVAPRETEPTEAAPAKSE